MKTMQNDVNIRHVCLTLFDYSCSKISKVYTWGWFKN
jgi:hypothetical protein